MDKYSLADDLPPSELEPISQMPEQDANASEVHEAEKVFCMALVACHESPVVLKPREEPFDPPATPHPTKWAAILSLRALATTAVDQRLDNRPLGIGQIHTNPSTRGRPDSRGFEASALRPGEA